jgi:MFS family permease
MPYGGLWRDRDFLKLWGGQAVSQLGSHISGTALPLAAIQLLGASPQQMALLAGAAASAVVLFGLFAGAWADRVRRRPLLIFADLGRAAIMGSIPLAAVLHHLTMGHLYVAAAAGGLLTVLFDSGYQAYVPALVERERILEANSKLALTTSLADVGGPAAGGLLVVAITAPMAILVDAASFLCSAFSLALIKEREPLPQPAAQPHVFREIAEGLRASWSGPTLKALTRRSATAPFFMGIIGGLYFVFAIRELRLNAALLGAIISIGGLSNLWGALISERLVRRFGFGRVLIGSAAACAGAALAPPLARGSAAMCAAFLIAGQAFDMAWPIYQINELSLRQTLVPDRLLGRVGSAMRLLFHGMMALGALAGGLLAQSVGVRGAMLAGAVGFLLSNIWLAASPIRSLRTLADASSAAIAATSDR